MADDQESDLLRALEQLDDPAWAQTLLPLLRADKSAGAFALACQQLRQLVHSNQRELKLTGTNCSGLNPSALDTLSRPFPATSSVEFAGDISHFAAGIPMLARLPHLTCLRLVGVQDETASQPDNIVEDLERLRLQLPQLRSLQLSLRSGWGSDSQQAWAALGAITQLTQLVIEFRGAHDGSFNVFGDDDDEQGRISGIGLQHLTALQPLSSSLRHLDVQACGPASIAGDGPQDCSFLSSFSGLTELWLPLSNERAGLAPALGSCTRLQELAIGTWKAPDGRWPQIDAAECAALAQLTKLTHLSSPSSADTPALLAALQCLRRLQYLQLDDMSSSHLPALATLTGLVGLGGGWADEATQPSAAGAALVTCPCVRAVWVSGPCLPLAAFPGATWMQAAESAWQPSRLLSISQQLQKLRVLCIDESAAAGGTFRSLDPTAPQAQRVAAVRSLGQLAHLTRLQFALNDDAEAAALAVACTQLKNLGLFVPRGSSVTAQGLSCVCWGLRQLHKVSLCLHDMRSTQSQATLVLAGLSAVREVTLTTAKRKVAVWQAAAAAARQAGLPLPAACTINCQPPSVSGVVCAVETSEFV